MAAQAIAYLLTAITGIFGVFGLGIAVQKTSPAALFVALAFLAVAWLFAHLGGI